jgi:hypothetical protein
MDQPASNVKDDPTEDSADQKYEKETQKHNDL